MAKKTGEKAVYSTSAGKVFPCLRESPLMIASDGTMDLFVPIFDSAAKLEEFTARANIYWDSIQRVENWKVFFYSLPEVLDARRVRLAMNPWFGDDNKPRWIDVTREDLLK